MVWNELMPEVKKLTDHIEEKYDGSRSRYAAAICTSPISVRRYERGVRRPDDDVMKRIYEESDGKLQPNDFYELPELQTQKAS